MKEVYKADIIRHEEVAHQLWISHMLGHLGCVKQTIMRLVATARLNSQGELIGFGAKDDQSYSTYPSLNALKLLGTSNLPS
jgi:hypothetical protein